MPLSSAAFSKEGCTKRIAAFEPPRKQTSVPVMTIEVDAARFDHFHNSFPLPPIHLEMHLGILQEKSQNLYCAGKFYRLTSKVKFAIAYVYMIGKQPPHARSPLLPTSTYALVSC